jgi:hypothetical protein
MLSAKFSMVGSRIFLEKLVQQLHVSMVKSHLIWVALVDQRFTQLCHQLIGGGLRELLRFSG